MAVAMSKQRETQRERLTQKVIYDHVWELPQHISHYILSFLETKEAARTSVLSKGWRTAWSNRPFLDFDQADFGAIPFQKFDPRKEDMLLKFIDDTLELYHRNGIPIQRLRLHVSAVSPCKLFPLMKKWLPIVPQSGVGELDFNTRWEAPVLPAEIFRAESLRVLKVTSPIYGNKLVLGNNYNVIKCRNLKKLELDGITVDGVTFGNLVSHCHLIEELQLKDFGWPDVHIANLPNLRTLRLYCFGVKTVTIDSPSLQSLVCRCSGDVDLRKSGNLRSLLLSDAPITDVQLHNILSNNPLIEDLSLFSCTMLERINALSIFLKRVSFSGCRKLVEVVIDASNLHLLEYHYLSRTPLPVTRTTTKGSSIISIYCCGEIDASWFHMLREFLTKFRVSNVEITSYRGINFDSLGFRAIPLPHGHAVETLKVNYEESINVEHLEALFSICHPKRVLWEYADTLANNASFKSFCNELRNKKNPRCCDSDQIKCWRHYLNDVRFNVSSQEPRRPRLIRTEVCLEWKSSD